MVGRVSLQVEDEEEEEGEVEENEEPTHKRRRGGEVSVNREEKQENRKS